MPALCVVRAFIVSLGGPHRLSFLLEYIIACHIVPTVVLGATQHEHHLGLGQNVVHGLHTIPSGSEVPVESPRSCHVTSPPGTLIYTEA